MITNLYLTADEVDGWTGGQKVTFNESEALKTLGPCRIISRKELDIGIGDEPWKWDDAAFDLLNIEYAQGKKYDLCVGYAGTFGKSIKFLKDHGCKISWTVAAHDRAISKREHERLGIQFNYPHLVQPELWNRYSLGYLLSDVIICPGTVPAATVRAYGSEFANKRIEIVPHGCTPPKEIKSLPYIFTVGYLGAISADKGVRYLLEAWKKLNYSDAVLVLAGRDSANGMGQAFARHFGGGAIVCRGWVDDVADFYNQISLFIAPAASEGFNIECVEALAHGRPVLVSEGAGACDVVPRQPLSINFNDGQRHTIPFSWTFPACDADALAAKIDAARKAFYPDVPGYPDPITKVAQTLSVNYDWKLVREKYVSVWRSLL